MARGISSAFVRPNSAQPKKLATAASSNAHHVHRRVASLVYCEAHSKPNTCTLTQANTHSGAHSASINGREFVRVCWFGGGDNAVRVACVGNKIHAHKRTQHTYTTQLYALLAQRQSRADGFRIDLL